MSFKNELMRKYYRRPSFFFLHSSSSNRNKYRTHIHSLLPLGYTHIIWEVEEEEEYKMYILFFSFILNIHFCIEIENFIIEELKFFIIIFDYHKKLVCHLPKKADCLLLLSIRHEKSSRSCKGNDK